MGLQCWGGNPGAEFFSVTVECTFSASELGCSFPPHSCPLSEVILSWHNFQFDKFGSQSCCLASLGFLKASVLEGVVAKEQCRKELLYIFSNLQSK